MMPRAVGPQRGGRRIADQIATLSLGLVAIATAVFAYSLTPLFVMLTDSCRANCNTAIRLGVWITWLGKP